MEQRLLGWCQTQFRITLNQNHKLEWGTSFNWYLAVFKLTNIVGAISNLDKKQCYLIKSLEMETDEQRKTSSCCCWKVRILCSCPSVSWRLLFWGWWVPGWYGCAVVQCGWPSWLQRSKYSQLFTYSQKRTVTRTSAGMIFQPTEVFANIFAFTDAPNKRRAAKLVSRWLTIKHAAELILLPLVLHLGVWTEKRWDQSKGCRCD